MCSLSVQPGEKLKDGNPSHTEAFHTESPQKERATKMIEQTISSSSNLECCLWKYSNMTFMKTIDDPRKQTSNVDSSTSLSE